LKTLDPGLRRGDEVFGVGPSLQQSDKVLTIRPGLHRGDEAGRAGAV